MHYHHPVRQGSLIHKVGNIHHSNALFPVQPLDSADNLLPPHRIQHGSRLIQHQTFRVHGKGTSNGNSLLLAAAEKMGSKMPELLHIYRLQCGCNPAADFVRLHADILRPKAHIILHNGSNNLIVWILEHHAHLAPDIPDMLLLSYAHVIDQAGAPIRLQQGIKMLGQSGFA